MKQLFNSTYFIIFIGLGLLTACGEDGPDPIQITVSNFTKEMPENPNNGDIIGTLTSSVNRGEIVYQITSQEPSNAIEVDANTGQLTVKNKSQFNYERKTTITASFSATVESITETGTITITLTDVYETVQQRLNSGDLPIEIVDDGISVDSLFGKTFAGGSIAYYFASGGAMGDCLILYPDRIATNKTWSQANSEAQNFIANGYSDWELPTDSQRSLFCGKITNSNKDPFPPLYPTSKSYWTRTACGGICYRSFFLQSGACSSGGSPSSNLYDVMAVRVYQLPR